jgi:hypothetical protein
MPAIDTTARQMATAAPTHVPGPHISFGVNRWRIMGISVNPNIFPITLRMFHDFGALTSKDISKDNPTMEGTR